MTVYFQISNQILHCKAAHCRAKICLAEISTLQRFASNRQKDVEHLTEELAMEMANSSAQVQIDILQIAINTKSLPTSPELLLLICGELAFQPRTPLCNTKQTISLVLPIDCSKMLCLRCSECRLFSFIFRPAFHIKIFLRYWLLDSLQRELLFQTWGSLLQAMFTMACLYFALRPCSKVTNYSSSIWVTSFRQLWKSNQDFPG